MRITLLGYMGSGKSTLGRALADRLSLPFFDLDSLIEEKSGQSIPAIFQKGGELRFRQLEREILLELLESERAFVLAVGGGTPCYYDNMDLLLKNSSTVYLKATPSQLYERLQGEQSNRPMIAHLQDEQLLEYIAKHLFERTAFYTQAQYQVPHSIEVEELQHIITANP